MSIPRIAIVGAGIVGATAAYQLSKQKIQLSIFDDSIGQATAAAAGIICPWLSQRRNKKWYHLVAKGASYYPNLMQQLRADGVQTLPYQQVGAFVFKKNTAQLETLYKIAQERRKDAPLIGDLQLYSPADIQRVIPNWAGEQAALYASGGARVDGARLTAQLVQIAKQNGADYTKGNVQLRLSSNNRIQLRHNGQDYSFDRIILASGAWLAQLLQPLNLTADVRAQKGQLIEYDLPIQTTTWPVCMLHGEFDFIPFPNGRLVVGATHENDQGFDLTPDPSLLASLHHAAVAVFPTLRTISYTRYRIGTRAYTSDFSPFFGPVPEFKQLYVASGLGSSGLTSGALIGQLLADHISERQSDFESDWFSPKPYISYLSDKEFH